MKRSKFFHILAVALSLVTLFAATAHATSSEMTFEEAKEYLENYRELQTNSAGKEVTIQYHFGSEESLNRAASYIADYGLDAFNDMIDKRIEEAVSQEQKGLVPLPRTTNPTTYYATVPCKSGHYNIVGTANGFCDFGKMGTAEYRIELRYTAHVSNESFFLVNNIELTPLWTSYADGIVEITEKSCPSFCYPKNCGVTANYIVSKGIPIDPNDPNSWIDASVDHEVFPVNTTFE